METKITREGIAECIIDPKGAHGLTQFKIKHRYKFQYALDGYYIIYYINERFNDERFKTCGIHVFNRFFKRIEEKKIK